MRRTLREIDVRTWCEPETWRRRLTTTNSSESFSKLVNESQMPAAEYFHRSKINCITRVNGWIQNYFLELEFRDFWKFFLIIRILFKDLLNNTMPNSNSFFFSKFIDVQIIDIQGWYFMKYKIFTNIGILKIINVVYIQIS